MLFFLSPDLDKDKLCYEIINRFSVTGIKGIIIIGVLSMGMSTADSFINISSVILANDTYKAETASPMKKLYSSMIISDRKETRYKSKKLTSELHSTCNIV